MRSMRLRALAVAATLVISAAACAQDTPQATPAACPDAAQASHRDLLGLWNAQIEGRPGSATIVLRQHPDLAESVRGTVARDGHVAEVSGDLDDGEFTLEESANGVNISAVWLGDVVEGSCGREIRGNWQAEGEPASHPFVLRKQ